MVTQFYYTDFDDYSVLFSKHSKYVVELMCIFNDQLVKHGLEPIEDSSKLFTHISEFVYHVDSSYRVEKQIPDKYDVITFPYNSKNEMLDSMRSLLREELDRYLGYSNEAN